MAVTAFFSAFMGVVVFFFSLSGNMGSPAHWIYAISMLAVFAAMIHTRAYSRWRRVFQVSFALLFMISFIGILYDERGSMSLTQDTIQSGEVPFCQIVIPAIIAPFALTGRVIFPARMTGHFASVMGMILLWFIATVTIGRGWCGWVCFYGGWEEGASRILKKPRVNLLSRNKDLRSFQFAFLFFVVLMSLGFMSSVYCEWFCPFKLVTEYAEISDLPSLIATVIFIGLFLGLVIVLPLLTRKRTQCSALCPFGAFQSLMDRFSSYRVVIDVDKCVRCMKCAEACSFCAIDRETIREEKGRPELTCAKCGECLSVCPTGAIRYEFSFQAASDARIRAKGCSPVPKNAPSNRFGAYFQAILDPQYLFVFTAFTFSVIVSGKFIPDAFIRIASIAFGGPR